MLLLFSVRCATLELIKQDPEFVPLSYVCYVMQEHIRLALDCQLLSVVYCAVQGHIKLVLV